MRWKIIIVNAGIVIVVGLLTYVLLATSLKDVLANQAERKREVAQALRAADSQLALDALRMERWLDSNATAPSVHAVLAGGTADARSNPSRALAIMKKVTASDPKFLARAVPATLRLLAGSKGVGCLSADAWQRFGDWMRARGLLKQPIAAATVVDANFLPRRCR